MSKRDYTKDPIVLPEEFDARMKVSHAEIRKRWPEILIVSEAFPSTRPSQASQDAPGSTNVAEVGQ